MENEADAATGKPHPETGKTADRTPAISEADFRHIRDEILAEMPVRWKTWFFHPAWTAAAAALLIAAVLVSSLSRRGGNSPMPENPPRQPAPPPARRDRLPPSRPNVSPSRTDSPNPAPAMLAEAAAAIAPAGEKAPETTSQFPAADPLQLIERPKPIDDDKLSWDLAVLAGLQIGGKEWDDAEQTIALLSRRHPEKAAILAEMLAAGRSAAARKAASGDKPSEPTPPVAAEYGPTGQPSAPTAAASQAPTAAPGIEAVPPAATSGAIGTAGTEAAANPETLENPESEFPASAQLSDSPVPAALSGSTGPSQALETAETIKPAEPANRAEIPEPAEPTPMDKPAPPIFPGEIPEEAGASNAGEPTPQSAPAENGADPLTDAFSPPARPPDPALDGIGVAPSPQAKPLPEPAAKTVRRRPFSTDPYIRDQDY